MGPVHALCLQLLASRIIELSVDADGSKKSIGKSDLSVHNIVIISGRINGQPRPLFDRYWEGINTSNDEIRD
jgi:hypothetical protein